MLHLVNASLVGGRPLPAATFASCTNIRLAQKQTSANLDCITTNEFFPLGLAIGMSTLAFDFSPCLLTCGERETSLHTLSICTLHIGSFAFLSPCYSYFVVRSVLGIVSDFR